MPPAKRKAPTKVGRSDEALLQMADEDGIIDLTGDGLPSTRAQPPAKRQQTSSRGRGGRGSRGGRGGRSATQSSSQPSRDGASQNFDEDGDVPNTTQDDGPQKELYGSLATKIVGVRYYSGYAAPEEVVLCVREPDNPYDSNAIVVSNVEGVQIGHIPRNVALKVAGYVDREGMSMEGVLTGEKAFYDCPMRLFLYGPSDPATRARLEESLKKDKLIKATELKNTRVEAERVRTTQLMSNQSRGGFADEDLADMSLEELAKMSQAIDSNNRADSIKGLAMTEEEMAAMPMADQPAAMKAQLLPYQRQGLAWMLSKENPRLPEKGTNETVQLWKWHQNGRSMVNIATNFHVSRPAELLSGGILADDMGLGKTIQVISIIMAGEGSGPTLIVAPVSVMSNWKQQIEKHVVADKAPRVLIHHPSSPDINTPIEQDDVVVTSYGKMTRDKDGSGVLMGQHWRRVVLDEGHTIRNAKTNAAKSACELKAKSRWVLTGTPIINNVKDLHSMLKFLHIKGGIENSEIFNTVIARPLGVGQPKAEALLQNIMRDLCLRRRKDMDFVDLKLPPKTEYVHRIQFRDDEKAKYKALLDEAKGAFEDFKNKSVSGPGQFQNVLERLLRLRQVCNHWALCRKRVDDLLKVLEDHSVIALNPENRSLLQEALRIFIENQEDCPVCFEPLTDPVITHCKHVYCRPCITKVIDMQHKCPMCRNKLDHDEVLEPAPEEGEDGEAFDSEKKSSKTEALLQILQATMKKEGSKVIIFSQWTSFLNIIQNQVAEAGYKYTRIDGSMKADHRDAAISALDNDPDTRILLASLSVCSVGLNLVSADTVILSDSWWAPAIEDQAVDRVHRLGQTRPTTIWRLVMEDSIEERVLGIQATKRELVTKAFREKKKKGEKRSETRMADVMKLLS